MFLFITINVKKRKKLGRNEKKVKKINVLGQNVVFSWSVKAKNFAIKTTQLFPIVERTGIEPVTSRLRTWRSAN
jgi:hypothetical protein